MRVTKLCTVLVMLLSLVVLPALHPTPVAAQGTPPTSFAEEFDSSVLDPAWQVIEYPRGYNTSYPYPPGHYSLTDHAGYLRYYVDPAIHHEGFLNGYLPTNDYTAPGQIMDAGLELHRTFSGDHWVIETKAAYYMPFSNGRAFAFRVYFGNGGPGTLYVGFQRFRDGPWRQGTPETTPVWIQMAKRIGPNSNETVYYQQAYPPPVSNDTYYYRLERAGATLTSLWSTDGVTWNTAFVQDTGAELDGLGQRVVLAGLSWYTPAGSYADYDYVRLAPANLPPDCSGASASTMVVWPPKHQFVPINVLGVTDPDGDATTINIGSIYQDEPVDTNGDGSFTPDGKGVGTATAEVRAERVGTPSVPGNGRFYHILFTATDGHGLTCSGEVLVNVPHDQNKAAVDGGALYDSTVR